MFRICSILLALLAASSAHAAPLQYDFEMRFTGWQDETLAPDLSQADPDLLAAMSTDLTVGKVYSGALSIDPIPATEQISPSFTRYTHSVSGITITLEEVFTETSPTFMDVREAGLLDIDGNIDALSVGFGSRPVLAAGEFRSVLSFNLGFTYPDAVTSNGILPLDLLASSTQSRFNVSLQVLEGDPQTNGSVINLTPGARTASFEIERFAAPTPVPVPPSVVLLGGGIAAFGSIRYRRRRRFPG